MTWTSLIGGLRLAQITSTLIGGGVTRKRKWMEPDRTFLAEFCVVMTIENIDFLVEVTLILGKKEKKIYAQVKIHESETSTLHISSRVSFLHED